MLILLNDSQWQDVVFSHHVPGLDQVETKADKLLPVSDENSMFAITLTHHCVATTALYLPMMQ